MARSRAKNYSTNRLSIGLIAILLFSYNIKLVKSLQALSRHDADVYFRQNVSCSDASTSVYEKYPECGAASCGRVVVDRHFDDSEISALRAIAEKGMATREDLGGPTILDLNTGYVRDSAGLQNLFLSQQGLFTADEFASYGRIIAKLKRLVEDTFQVRALYFTAPTFLTRLDGRAGWEPREIHDEYWHTHADMASTPHYHYSGLLYLSSFEEDFLGGRFRMVGGQAERDGGREASAGSSDSDELIVEPRRGRVVMFTSGWENPHYVERVTQGQRLVLSFWFTCDADKEFEIFLDGQAHVAFSRRIQQQLERQRERSAAAARGNPPDL